MDEQYYTKDEISFIKILSLKPIAGARDNENGRNLRAWLPVTYIDQSNNKRVTVRAPYPIGDADTYPVECPDCAGTGRVESVMCNACEGTGTVTEPCCKCHGTGHLNGDCEVEYPCPYCSGTGSTTHTCSVCHGDKEVNIATDDDSAPFCPTCGGSGKLSDSHGALRLDANGVMHLQYDNATLGIDETGHIFAKYVPKTKGGLGVVDGESNKELYVNIDNRTITIDQDGQLHANPVIPSYVAEFSDAVVQIVEPTCLFENIPSHVDSVKVHVEVNIHNPDYAKANELTNFELTVGSVQSETYCLDQTRPYTTFTFDTVQEVASSRKINLSFDLHDNDTFPEQSEIIVDASIIAC